MNFWDLFWLILILASFQPLLKQRWLEAARQRIIRKLESKHGSRVITILHRQESMAFLGIPIARYINIEDSERVLRAIRMTPENMPIDIIMHTPGGLVLAAEQIAKALDRHPAKITVFVPHYAMSGGTLIALAADEIVMDENAVLGPVDPQLGQYPAASIVKTVSMKDANELDDETLILADISRKALQQVHTVARELMERRGMDVGKAEEIATQLSSGIWTHDYPISAMQARDFGLNVSTEMPMEVYQLMELYPQPGQHKASVDFIPIPYAPRRPSNGRQGNER